MATSEQSERYGTTKYTCQSALAAAVPFPNASLTTELLNREPAEAAEETPVEQSTENLAGLGGELPMVAASEADAAACIADGSDCKNGVDCCGVCVFAGRGSSCQTCAAPGEECSGPYQNSCCGGATKSADQGIVNPQYTCQGTGKLVGPYSIEKYTCQSAKP